mmetsp:Transcript_33531/g.60570  ORF Transcript_33531/g.60570 Transcript_33531/m.60570 type:complete len:525 (-) Transcript_33531:739-2313(-)
MSLTSCRHYTSSDVQHLKSELQTLEGEVDVLLTCEWPKAVTQGVPEGLLPQDLPIPSPGSEIVAEIVTLSRPRYHLTCSTVGGANLHFVRPPFTHRDLGAGIRSTRFISLASLAHPTKQKAMHALNLSPCNDMDPSVLSSPPEGATPSPFEVAAKRPMPEPEPMPTPNWRFEMPEPKRFRREAPKAIEAPVDIPFDPTSCVIIRNAPWSASAEDVTAFFQGVANVVSVSRPMRPDGKLQSWIRVQFSDSAAAVAALSKDKTEMMGRSIGVELGRAGTRPPREEGEGGRWNPLPSADNRPHDGCWFCLASSAADTDLVMSVGEDTYLAFDKGAVSPSHTLIVPVEHQASTATCTPGCFAETEKYLSALRTFYRSKNLEVVGFERNISLRRGNGNHCHVNTVALTPAAAKLTREKFTEALEDKGFHIGGVIPSGLSPLETQAKLYELVGDGEYFLVILATGERLVSVLPFGTRFPLGLGREVLASLAGTPERAVWKNSASVNHFGNDATTWAEELRTSFEPFDPMH